MQKCIYLSIVGLFLLCSLALADFVDNGDGTVTDTATGLMWQKFEVVDDEGEVRAMNWEEALDYCETLMLAGYDDWRLPNINELQSIVDYKKVISEGDPAIDKDFFPNALAYLYWSSTTFAYTTSNAWVMYFSFGPNNDFNKSRSFNVRAVRAGQFERQGNFRELQGRR